MVVKVKNKTIRFGGKLTLFFRKEGGSVVAYCPALELSSYGNNQREAEKNFREVLSIFLEDLIQNGTLKDVLQECGFRFVRQPHPHWKPPECRTKEVPLDRVKYQCHA